MSLDRKQVAAVRKLISSPDEAAVDQGLHLVESLENPELWQLVLDEAWTRPKAAHRMKVWLRAVSHRSGLRLSSAADAGDDRVAYTVSGVEIPMMRLPPGVFLMGSPPSDRQAWSNEQPPHLVRLTRGFELGVTPVTNAQWAAVMGEDPPSYCKDPSRPVTMVKVADAERFCARLGEVLGEAGFRLPTEAEWEYACRAGCAEPRYGELDDIAWYEDNASSTMDVGLKQPNAWGLHDKLGNVWEWTSDTAYREYTNASLSEPLVDPKHAEGSYRVGRGGSWKDDARGARAGCRDNGGPGLSAYKLGFRLARTAP